MGKGARAALPALAMAVLILDTPTALQAGIQGVQLCIQTLIPSLFPFFLFSTMLTASLTGISIRPLERLLRLPTGGGSIFLVGLLGGYPVGAQSVIQVHKQGLLSQKDARRMLAFCSNAGPAFLFGMGARLFGNMALCYLVWVVHILSAILVGLLTPGRPDSCPLAPSKVSLTLPQALRKSIQTLALVCGWVVIFRILLGFLRRWCLWLLPAQGDILISGLLELANGCCRLPELASTGAKLTLFSVFLGFGGLCVALQTRSVAQEADCSLYLPGKLLQGAVSYLLTLPCQWLLPEGERMQPSIPIILLCVLLCASYCVFSKRTIKRRAHHPPAKLLPS